MDIIRSIRVEAARQKISISEIARRLGVSQASLSQMLKRDSIKFSTVQRIADVINVSVNKLVDEMHPDDTQHGHTASASNSMVAGNIEVIDYSHSTICPEQLQEAHRKIASLEARLEQIDKLLAEKDNVIGEKERLIQILLK
jgi:DNA-binding Xre family transcriptional regulator